MTSPASLRGFYAQYPVRPVKRGQFILYQGEVPRRAIMLESGMAKTTNLGADGSEKTITFAGPGELFPLAWIFGKSSVALFNYEAFTDCQIRLIPRDELHEHLAASAETSAFLLDHYVTSYVAATLHINALEHSRASEKLLRLLQHLVMRFGTEAKARESQIALHLTQQDLANMIGLTRETTAIELGKLKKQKIIRYQSQFYTVRTDRLLQAIGDDEVVGVDLGTTS